MSSLHPFVLAAAVALLTTRLLAAKSSAADSGTCAARDPGAAGRAWKSIEKECRDKLEKNRTLAAMRCLEGHFREAREPGRRDGDWYTTLRKLRHDAEMFTWLEQESKVKTEVKKLYRSMYHSARPQHVHHPDKVFELSFQEQNDDRKLWQQSHNKAAYIDPSGNEMPAKTVRAKTAAFRGLEDTFISSGYAVVDRLLTEKALRLLRRFLQASTFYFYPRSGRHLLALLEDGLASPLLAQLADGLRQAMPTVLGPLPLTGARAWKADNSALAGNGAGSPELANSSAAAAVSLLLWTVPVSALNGTATDALRLHSIARASGADAVTADDESSIQQLGNNMEEPSRVKYVANRAVLWGASVEPEWYGPGWKGGFLNRGIHLLLTFGWSKCDG